MQKRVTPGKYVPAGTFYTAFKCNGCGAQITGAVWKACDGEVGTWCAECNRKGVKSPVHTVEVEDVKWIPGKVEVKCCGEWLECSHFTNTCEHCGADYNHAGQHLSPRSQWGEETGETAADVLGL